MRILQLVDSLNYGGAERMVVNLASGLRSQGHEVVVMCLREFGEKLIDFTPITQSSVKLQALNKPSGFHMRTLSRLRSLVRDERIDVVNTHNHLVHHYGLGAVAASPVKLVGTLHGIDTLTMPAWAKGLYWLGCMGSDRVVAVCRPVLENLRQRYRLPSKKLAVIENGVQTDDFASIPLRTKRSPVVFGTVGRMVPVKDHENLLNAFALLHKSRPECRLRFLGSGALENKLRAMVDQLGLNQSVEFCGFDPNPARFLSGLDVFVLSSKTEGLPVTLIEAMAAGLPVIATDVGGVPEVVPDDVGWLCPPQDSAALAQRMAKSLHANLPKMGAQARRRACSQYSAHRMVQSYEALYQTLCRAVVHPRSQHAKSAAPAGQPLRNTVAGD